MEKILNFTEKEFKEEIMKAFVEGWYVTTTNGIKTDEGKVIYANKRWNDFNDKK